MTDVTEAMIDAGRDVVRRYGSGAASTPSDMLRAIYLAMHSASPTPASMDDVERVARVLFAKRWPAHHWPGDEPFERPFHGDTTIPSVEGNPERVEGAMSDARAAILAMSSMTEGVVEAITARIRNGPGDYNKGFDNGLRAALDVIAALRINREPDSRARAQESHQ